MRLRPALISALVGLALPPPPAPAQAGPRPLVNLERWGGRAAHVPNRGPGQEYYQLDAVASWAQGAPADASRYRLRVTFPDGRTLDQDLAASQAPPARRVTFYVPTSAVRNLMPQQVVVQAVVFDGRSGQAVSNVLTARIGDFPHPGSVQPDVEDGPFDWGRPLSAAEGSPRPLERRSPDGFSFVRFPGSSSSPGFYLATTEATNQQVRDRLPGYDPDAGRSDDFRLSGPRQPALNLTPAKAEEYLAALSSADGTGAKYRLPTRDEWLRAARAGKSTAFWWGDEPTFPGGANFLGAEPSLPEETTAPASTKAGQEGFKANPWGLFHTFGNVAEWATTPEGGFLRLGGHFRTEPASPLPDVPVEAKDQLGPDPYVGVRPALDLDDISASALITAKLQSVDGLEGVTAAFDPDTGVVSLNGIADDLALRREASRLMSEIWFVSGVSDRIATPTVGSDFLVELGDQIGQPRRVRQAGRVYDVYKVKSLWAGRLPVTGSSYYVNVYLPGGQHYAYLPLERNPGGPTLDVLIDQSRMPSGGLPDVIDVNVGVSLGFPASEPTDRNLVSNLTSVRIRIR